MGNLVIYEQLKYWLPVASGFVLAYKGFKSLKANIDGWAETLFKNHLSFIREATTNTVNATNRTNELLEQRAAKDFEIGNQVAEVKADLVQQQIALLAHRSGLTETLSTMRNDLKEHENKEMVVWQGVVNTLTLLEDRSRRQVIPDK